MHRWCMMFGLKRDKAYYKISYALCITDKIMHR